MDDEISEWYLEHARREAEDALVIPEGIDAATHDSTSQTRATAAGGLGGIQGNPADNLPSPVDITGLIPPPRQRDKDNPQDPLPSISLTPIEEESSETEETAEAIATRINDMNTTEEKPKVEKRSKTKARNIQRRRAKARSNEAARAEDFTNADESGLQKLTIGDQEEVLHTNFSIKLWTSL